MKADMLPGLEIPAAVPSSPPLRRLAGRRGMRRVLAPTASDRGAPQRHRCPAPNCAIYIPMHRLACSTHWFQLPDELRSRINRTYRKNRRAHLEAYREAVRLLGATTTTEGTP